MSPRRVRLEAGIRSQESLAAKPGVHRNYVGRLERAESGFRVDSLAAILAPLGVSLSGVFQAVQGSGAAEDSEEEGLRRRLP